MQKQIGDVVKEARKAKRMTQKELANGICTQATVSNLENNNSVPAVRTLLAIGERLKIDFSDLSEYLPVSENGHRELFYQVKELFKKLKYKEAKDLLLKKIKVKDLTESIDVKEYNYYMGMASLMGDQNFSDAHYHFNLSMQASTNKNVDILDSLTTNGIAVAYFMANELDKSKYYFEKSLAQLEEIRKADVQFSDVAESIKIYYNSAKYYSAVKNYTKAIELCSAGIKLQKEDGSIHGLELLLYEKGINLCKQGKIEDAGHVFYLAVALCELNDRKDLIQTIKKDSQEYKIESLVFSYKI
ncbi:helix-turn-helix domain-containing protein [Carnobacterium maltaromaticum]|uniref:helix-turn-helix domain-containing protein n=1 Tax=Carnobacterium maltaromaticum TaxID=2751 RepID=UPI0039B069EA